MLSAALYLGLAACLLCAGSAAAEERGPAPEPPPAWLVFGGASAGSDHAAIHGGIIVAPSRGLWEPGLRLRAASAAGFYRTGAEQTRRTIPFASNALLAGYQLTAGAASLAFHAGPEAAYFARSDPPHHRAGWHIGVRALAEAHLDLDARTSADGHVAYGSALGRLEAGARVLTRLAGPWRAGPQAAYFDKSDGRDLRLGLALARRLPRSGLSAGAGLSFSDGKDAAPYLTIGFDQSF
jgi:hypothetical protein